MKTTTFSFLLLLFISGAFSQTKPTFGDFKTNVIPTLFDEEKSATKVFYTIEWLGKTTWEDHPNANTINLNPKNFSWYKDAKFLESYKYWFINGPKQDICGRDLPTDINSELTQKIYSKDIIYR
ncbi:MAG: hypothetical protein V4648_04905 [Bacteroidota bacterium]